MGKSLYNTDGTMNTKKSGFEKEQAFINTTALGISATYTGATIDGAESKVLTGYVTSDQAGTLKFEHSEDGVDFVTLTTTSVSAGAVVKFEERIYLRYVRAVYTNGATAQTTFKIVGFVNAE